MGAGTGLMEGDFQEDYVDRWIPKSVRSWFDLFCSIQTSIGGPPSQPQHLHRLETPARNLALFGHGYGSAVAFGRVVTAYVATDSGPK